MSLASFIKIAVILILNILAITFPSFLDIYVGLMREAHEISIIVSYPCGVVVFTKKVAKMLENRNYGSF